MTPTETFYTIIGLLAIALVFYVNANLYKSGT
jgi:hypothetical protein